MSSGTSVTDIAAKISLDYSAYMQGIKVVESRAVDMAKAIANPNYPSPIPDVGASHVDDYAKDLISADERTTAIIVANRQKIYAFDKEAHAYRIRAAKETAVLEKQRADAAAIEAQRVAAMHQYDQQRRKQEADDIAEASEKLRMRMERDAKLQASIDSLFSSQKLKLEEQAHAGDRIYFLAKRQAEEYARLLSIVNEIYRVESMSGALTAARVQELSKVTSDFQKLQQDEMDFEVNAKTAKEAEKRKAIETQIVSLLDQQKAKNDEIYAQHLRDRKARSEFARLLLEARKTGVPNATLQPLVQDFNYAQVEQQRARQDQKDIAVLNNLSKARKQDAQVMAYRKQLQEEDVALQKRAEQILRSLMTAQDLHNERVKEYTILLSKGKFTQEQFNAAVKESERVMKTSGKGAGAYTGMLAQASFAAEDFIQGIAMGDLRAALLGASNNLTMVARGAFEAAEGVTILGMSAKTFAAYALAIPAAVGGLVAYTSWLNRAAKDTRDLSTVLRDTARGFELVEQSTSFRQQAGRERQRIDEIEDITQAQRELKKATTDQAEAEERLVKARAKRSREGTDILISTLGGQDAYIELQNLIHDLGESEHQASIALGQAMEQSLAGAFGAAQAGEAEKMINYLRELNDLSNSMIMQNAKPGGLFENLNILLNDITAQDSLEAVFNTGFLQQTEDQERLREIREKMLQISLDIAKAENDVKQATTNKADSERRILELKQDQIRLQNEALKEEQRIAEQQRLQRQAEMQGEADMLEEKRKQQVFDLQATENQKEMLRIQQQMREFMGPAGTVQPLAMSSITGPLAAALMMGQMQQEAQAAGVQFLEAQAANLEKEIAALQQSSSPEVIGGMQQDAFQAQADAFKQIFAAENKQPNPQLTRQIQLLADIKAAIAKGAVFQLVGP